VHRPSEKVRQAEYEQEETAHHCDARAQKDCEHHRCHLRLEEGSENEDKGNSDEGWGIKEDDLNEDEDGGTQVGCPLNFCAPL